MQLGGLRGEELLEDPQHSGQGLHGQDVAHALGQVGAQQIGQGGHLSFLLPQDGREQRREQRLVGVAQTYWHSECREDQHRRHEKCAHATATINAFIAYSQHLLAALDASPGLALGSVGTRLLCIYTAGPTPINSKPKTGFTTTYFQQMKTHEHNPRDRRYTNIPQTRATGIPTSSAGFRSCYAMLG
jgi:hypothetical protein